MTRVGQVLLSSAVLWAWGCDAEKTTTPPSSASPVSSSRPEPSCCGEGIVVSTFNLAGLNVVRIPTDREARIHLQAKHLQAADAGVSVVALQEVYPPSAADARAGIDHRQSIRAALEPDFEAVGVPEQIAAERLAKSGLMLFFRPSDLRLIATSWHWLPPGRAAIWPRGLLCADLEQREGGSVFRVCTTHFSPLALLENQRSRQVDAVVDWSSGQGPFGALGPVVLAGDFNLAPSYDWLPDQAHRHERMFERDRLRYAALLDALGAEAWTPRPTLDHENSIWELSESDAEEPNRRVDLIFASGGRVSEGTVFLDSPYTMDGRSLELSDHYAVQARVCPRGPD